MMWKAVSLINARTGPLLSNGPYPTGHPTSRYEEVEMQRGTASLGNCSAPPPHYFLLLPTVGAKAFV
jgi:hypothetical protein